jgi:hypothetical protein
MRRSRLTVILAPLAIAVVAVIWFLAERPALKPAISIGVLEYRNWGKGPSLSVRLGITNTGRITIRYNQLNFDGRAVLRTESHRGWTDRDIGPGAVFPWMTALLPRGSNTFAIIALPADTLRWQIKYPVRAACMRDRVMARIPRKWSGRLRPICGQFFSDKEGPEQMISSEVFELPYILRASNDNVPPPSVFDPLFSIPFGGER